MNLYEKAERCHNYPCTDNVPAKFQKRGLFLCRHCSIECTHCRRHIWDDEDSPCFACRRRESERCTKKYEKKMTKKQAYLLLEKERSFHKLMNLFVINLYM